MQTRLGLETQTRVTGHMTMRAMLMLKVKEKILDPKLLKMSDYLDSKGFFYRSTLSTLR